MRVELFTFSEGTAMDIEERGYSIFNIILEIVPAGLPLQIPKAALSLIVRREKHEPNVVEGKLSIFNNREPIQENIPLQIAFNGKEFKILRVNLNGIPVQTQGILSFQYESEEINETLKISVSDPPVSVETD